MTKTVTKARGVSNQKTAEKRGQKNGAWTTLGTTLYRYWLVPGSGSSSSSSSSSAVGPGLSSSSLSSSSASNPWGSAHMLKYVVNPDSYVRLAADPNAGGNPALAPDWLVAQYADNYFEYDGKNRVTLEAVEGGSRIYRYQYNGDTGDAGLIGPSGDFNAWTGNGERRHPAFRGGKAGKKALDRHLSIGILMAASTCGGCHARLCSPSNRR